MHLVKLCCSDALAERLLPCQVDDAQWIVEHVNGHLAVELSFAVGTRRIGEPDFI